MPTISGTSGNDNPLNGTSGADDIFGLGGNDTIFGLDGADYIEGGAGTDTIDGGAGADWIHIIDTLDIINGGTGFDRVTMDLSGRVTGVVIDLSALWRGGVGIVGVSGTLTSIELLGRIDATVLDDIIIVGADYRDETSIFGLIGNDEIYGGGGYDYLDGGDGNDILYSGAGGGVLFGGAGADEFMLESVSTVDGGTDVGGNDTLSFDLRSATSGISINLTSLWSGGVGAFGSASVVGIEQLGPGNHTTNWNDVVVLGAAHAYYSTLYLEGGDDVAIGSNSDETIQGDDGNDSLSGMGGDDTLWGEEGSDVLIGGTGDDSYIMTDYLDSIVELAGEGIDEVRVRAGASNWTLGANIENLTAIQSATHILIGNELDNEIRGYIRSDELYGRDGDDTLVDGGGGNGNEDLMVGGLGDDIYLVSVRGSSTIEYAGEGIDTVQTDISVYGLQANIENLYAAGNGAHDAMVGNSGNNTIIGGDGVDGIYAREGNDTLIGGFGAANTLLGQQGNDTYVVRAAGDTVIEFAGEGVDTVETGLSSFVLREHIEFLAYTGTGAFTGIGADDANTIIGGAGEDFLSGLGGDDMLIGGAGADLLLGGIGADVFRVADFSTGVDRILDFTSSTDKFGLDLEAFAHGNNFALVQGAAPVANSTSATFLYDANSGALSYDADGNGIGGVIQIALLNTGLTLSVGDFTFY